MKSYKNDFSRLETALRCGEPDRVPIAELDIDISIREAVLGRGIKTIKDEVDFWYQSGYDYVPVRYKLDFKNEQLHANGEGITNERSWAQEGHGPIQTWQDFENHPWPDPQAADLSSIDETAGQLPEGMKSILMGGGFLSNPTYLMGFESFCYAAAEQPELVEALFKKVGSTVIEMLKRAVKKPKIGAIWITSDMAYTEGLLVSPEILRKHVFPWLEEVSGICKENKIPFILHSDGRLWEVMDDFVAIGINGLHPIEPKAMDIEEVKKRYSRKLCLLGNVDLDFVLSRGTPEMVADEVQRKISALKNGGGYILSSSNSIPEYVPVDNYLAMLQAAHNYCY